MPKKLRPYVLSIGGFDPSNGAGIGADIKTFEQLRAIGLAVITANTIQTEDSFIENTWIDGEYVEKQLRTVLSTYAVEGVKIGLIQSLDQLNGLLDIIKELAPKAIITWDPILSATTGFSFHKGMDKGKLEVVLQKIDLVTPNLQELSDLVDTEDNLTWISNQTNVLLKGGHSDSAKGVDLLVWKGKKFEVKPRNLSEHDKHGTGCVLSSSMTVYLAKEYPAIKALLKSKQYIERFIGSNPTLLGYHKF